ncbi:MAG TPA: M20/M25/M40 family metallo-hydrolase [Pseudomonadales bacterium]|nr:M20/M25/M40 family metallo-hydrolase [Pseudomonadales bacterium]
MRGTMLVPSRAPWQRLALVILLGAGLALVTASARAAGAAGDPDPERALERLQAYLRIDTINPPGNESRAVAFLAAILDAEGIAYETFEAAPGRGSIVARIEGGEGGEGDEGDEAPALLLLNHSDVVPADASAWDEPPLSGAVRDGFMYGRGALDTKGLAMLQLEAFIALHRSGQRPDRDVLFAATADEEAGGYFGAGWLVRHRPELIEGVGLVLNEGGSGRLLAGVPVYGIEVTQKIPLWVRLTARGTPGHGSSPRVETAPNSLIRALERISEQRFTPRLQGVIADAMRATADLQSADMQPLYLDPAALITDPEAMLRLQLDSPATHAQLRDTCTVTRLAASLKINVVPATAWAEIDCRLLPDTDPDAFLASLRALIDDDGIQITRLMGFTAASSPTDTELYEVMRRTLLEADEAARVVPVMATGFTDSHFFRDLGITAYGFSPLLLPASEFGGVHGHNERVDVAAFRLAVQRYHRVVTDLVLH